MTTFLPLLAESDGNQHGVIISFILFVFVGLIAGFLIQEAPGSHYGGPSDTDHDVSVVAKSPNV